MNMYRPAPIETEDDVIVREIESKIMHILSLYPIISPTMLQVGIGTGLSPVIWQPVLNNMIIRGVIDKTQKLGTTPGGRHQTYTFLSLKHNRP